MKILITGGDGFVGRHFRETLQDHDITNIDLKSGNDCRDFFRNDNQKFDLIIHLAAVVGGRTLIKAQPLQLAAEDLSIDSEMWRWALRTRPEKIVYFSSSAAYPAELQQKPGRSLVESDIIPGFVREPDFSCGWVKLTGEMMARHAEEQGLNVFVFRPFSGYGVSQDPSSPWPSFIERARRKADPFDVWGDGTQTRDWIHIYDIVDAVMVALENNIKGPVNLCTGRPMTFMNLAALVMKAAGYKGMICVNPDMPSECNYRVGDPTKMLEFYTPKVELEFAVTEALK